MLKMLFLCLFVLLQSCWSMETVPLLQQDTSNGDWSMTKEAKEFLNKDDFQDRFVHIVGIGGSTRTGKSYLMSTLLERFAQDGTIHFGNFHHAPIMDSITKGIDVALVEYKEQLILLLDCEGMDSISSIMDEKLMVILSMITQKFMYVDKNINQNTMENLSTAITNRNVAMKPDGIPLDTLYLISNQSKLDRNINAVDDALKGTPEESRGSIINAFPIRKSFYVAKNTITNRLLFQEDITNLFNAISSNIEPFTLGGVEKFTVRKFIAYLEEWLTKMNENTDINFPDALKVRYEEFAHAKGETLLQDIPKCKNWCNDEKLRCELKKIQLKKDEFIAECEDYKHCIRTVYDKYLLRFDNLMIQFENDNENYGWEIACETRVEKSEEIRRKKIITQHARAGPGQRAGEGAAWGAFGGLFGSGLGAVCGAIRGAVEQQDEKSYVQITYLCWIERKRTFVNGQKSTETISEWTETKDF